MCTFRLEFNKTTTKALVTLSFYIYVDLFKRLDAYNYDISIMTKAPSLIKLD